MPEKDKNTLFKRIIFRKYKDEIDFFEKLNLKGDNKYNRYKLIFNSLILKIFIKIDNDQVNSKGLVIYNGGFYVICVSLFYKVISSD